MENLKIYSSADPRKIGVNSKQLAEKRIFYSSDDKEQSSDE
jgi:hypothetical protein